jgi:hypothetical protein
MYTAPFFSGPDMLGAFIVNTMSMVMEPLGDIEVNKNPSTPPASENMPHALP